MQRDTLLQEAGVWHLRDEVRWWKPQAKETMENSQKAGGENITDSMKIQTKKQPGIWGPRRHPLATLMRAFFRAGCWVWNGLKSECEVKKWAPKYGWLFQEPGL